MRRSDAAATRAPKDAKLHCVPQPIPCYLKGKSKSVRQRTPDQFRRSRATFGRTREARRCHFPRHAGVGRRVAVAVQFSQAFEYRANTTCRRHGVSGMDPRRTSNRRVAEHDPVRAEQFHGRPGRSRTDPAMPQAAAPPASGSRELRAKKEVKMSTTVPTAWQINASLTLLSGSFPGCADARQHQIEFCGDTSRRA
jgi:hypothetical protein